MNKRKKKGIIKRLRIYKINNHSIPCKISKEKMEKIKGRKRNRIRGANFKYPKGEEVKEIVV